MGSAAVADPALDLINPWQHGFPLQRRPFQALAAASGLSEDRVLALCRGLQADGRLSRIGGVFNGQAGGAALLAALAVPTAVPGRLEAVAACISAHPGVNHNYQREHRLNLWFVMTGRDAAAVAAAMDALDAATGLQALRLRMLRAYHIDLGFDLRQPGATPPPRAPRQQPIDAGAVPAVAVGDHPLAALAEAGLPLQPLPYDAWADRLGRPVHELLQTLQRWQDQGTLRRFGAVLRHHDWGIAANAMGVFNLPDALGEDAIDRLGQALGEQPGVTLAYRRERAAGWPFNLYCMVHGRDRDSVRATLAAARRAAGLDGFEHQLLFSCRRFKQTGARRFRESGESVAADDAGPSALHPSGETHHATA